MHIKNGDVPYKSTLDAMGYWPEKQTSVGVRLDEARNVVLQYSFDLSCLFDKSIDHNPLRSVEVFNERLAKKNWLKIWPELQAVYNLKE